MKTATLIPTQDSSTGTITGTYFDLGDDTEYSIQVYFSGSNVAGTLTIEACAFDPVNAGFNTITGSSQSVTSSGGVTYNVTGAGYRYIRPKWVYTSGTGNITGQIFVKDRPSK